MSACKTGCGAEAGHHNETLCPSCDTLFMASGEWTRFSAKDRSFEAGMVALADFCSRVRAERLSAQQGTWPAVTKEAQ